MEKKRIVVLTGSGISAESGLKTFREAGGLWEGHDVTQVASPEGFINDPEMVLRFYNERRTQARKAQPNPGHSALVRLEEKYDVHIITQNVDDLHERAGSSNVLHLHGMLNLARSVNNPDLIVEVEDEIKVGDLGEDGAQLRPHIVWFGESVPNIIPAAELTTQAELFIIIGTSLLVYPAASLMDYVPISSPIYVVDPHRPQVFSDHIVHFIEKPGSEGIPELVDLLLEDAVASS